MVVQTLRPWKSQPIAGGYPYITHGARALLENLNRFEPLVGVEVGVMKGKTSASLLARCPWLRLSLVDDFSDERHAGDRDPWQLIFEEAHFALDRLDAREGCSLTVCQTFGDDSLDFVFLDDDHSYEHVCKELVAWWPKVKPGGVFSGHDYGHRDFPGVALAVDEFVEEKGIHGSSFLEYGAPHYVWVIRKPE